MGQWPEAVLYMSLVLRTMPKGQGKHCIKNPASILEKEVIQLLLLSTLNRYLSTCCTSSKGFLTFSFSYIWYIIFFSTVLQGTALVNGCSHHSPDTKEYGTFTSPSVPLCWSLMFLQLTLQNFSFLFLCAVLCLVILFSRVWLYFLLILLFVVFPSNKRWC